MASYAGIFEAAQRACWMRPGAYRWIRPDALRFLAPGTDPRDVYRALQRKFNPDQPRVPAGNPDGGQAANKLVNSTIARNPDKVDKVVSGLSGKENLDAIFGSPTGSEAYAATEHSQPYIRETYGVRVVIVRDRRSKKGTGLRPRFRRIWNVSLWRDIKSKFASRQRIFRCICSGVTSASTGWDGSSLPRLTIIRNLSANRIPAISNGMI